MVQIITDTSALFTPEQGRQMGFDVMPLCVSVGDLEGRDLAMDMREFYARIDRGEIPQSSQPPIGEVLDMYEKYADREVINITMADGLSGTYQSACGVKEMVDNGDSVHVFNSKTLCGPHRYMVEKAQKLADEGKTAEEILSWLDYASNHNVSYLIPQDFGFLKRGGRLTPMAATLGSVLKLKPIMTQVDHGRRLDKLGVKRTMKSALSAVAEQMKKNGVDERHIVYVSHADALPDALFAVDTLKSSFPKTEVRLLDLSPAFVTQGGPKCVAIQYIER